ncbi:putative septum site-determining protein MinC [Gottschalkia purinilytica]|uniref:Probable septum site-determining protein MinC n=1 Tax=Gottschalkia purinilytica TaxID=1503 RepID=A0A0L0WDC6_GOTPU|nr:septum site-determining protein MinC [Gottschalkia purinilytica]KNF09450.1 putative septum site-determining protein MinC [Gottschalkia purinilytica]
MTHSLINFKGRKDGISIYIEEGSFQAIKDQLDIKIKNAGEFFKGAKVISIKGQKLTVEEVEELKEIIKNKYRMTIEDNEQEQEENKMEDIDPDLEAVPFIGIHEGSTKFIKTTVRSGQIIEYDGNVVVIGDINPGGMVVAKGNIVVLGSLRGIANAGSDGNRESIVAAFSLQPTQLRIADVIARKPDEDIQAPKWPEIARVYKDAVIIEPYLLKK